MKAPTTGTHLISQPASGSWATTRACRKFAGRVSQLITGSTGLDAWEWGVTLMAHQVDALKEIVYEMRFDEVTARYGVIPAPFSSICVSRRPPSGNTCIFSRFPERLYPFRGRRLTSS